MIVSLIILVILLVVMYALSFMTGTAIGRSLRLARLNVGTWWNNNVPNRPTRQQVWAAIRPIIWVIAILVGLMILAWAFLFFLIVGICTAMGSPINGIWLGILVITVAFLFILKKIPGFRTFGTISYYIMLVLLVVFSWNFIFGWWSPGIQQSWERLKGNKKQEIANSLDKGSLKSEPEMGVFAKVTDDSQVYNQAGAAVFFVQKGVTVKVADLNGKKANADAEGMTKVMLPNRHGDYQQGNEGWVPTRKLDWNWQVKAEKQGEKQDEKSSKASPAPAPEVKTIGKGVDMYFDTESLKSGKMTKISLDPGKYRYTLTGGNFESGCQCNPRFLENKCGEIFLFVGEARNQHIFPGEEFSISSLEEIVFPQINSHEKVGRKGLVKIQIERIG